MAARRSRARTNVDRPATVAAYLASLAPEKRTVIEAARDVPFTLPETELRKTQVWLVGYGENA